MLTLDNVTKRYGAGAPAVDGLSLHLPAGVVGLVGHNGAGKTTLMQMIATLARPTSGAILLDGVDIVRKPAAMRARLGYLPQDFGVYPNLSALEFMQYFAALKGVRDPARIRRLLETVNLAQHAHRQAAGFSGGMRRRLGIAQALLNDPDVLVVDEPTAGLDPEERVRFRQLLADLGAHRLVLVSNAARSGRPASKRTNTNCCAAACTCCRRCARTARWPCASPIPMRRAPARTPPNRAWKKR
jgi:ABC-2 type transport system ATP-binding protein